MMLVTGGSGKLGRALQAVFLHAAFPPRQELDLLRREAVMSFVGTHRPSVVLHAAAYTSVRGAEENKRLCWETNVRGTEWLVEALQVHVPTCYFVYVSTACVFYGDRGPYTEEDVPHPKNFYGLTKLVGEYVACRLPSSLVSRTNFVAREPWPYPQAFVDRYGTYLYADDVARALHEVIAHRLTGIVHIAGADRLSMFELARATTPTVEPISMQKVSLPLTVDMTLGSIRMAPYQLSRSQGSISAG